MYKPLNQSVLLRKLPKKQSGKLIITPDDGREEGVILAKSDDCEQDVSVGDTVMYNGWGSVTQLKGDLILIRCRELLCVVEAE